MRYATKEDYLAVVEELDRITRPSYGNLKKSYASGVWVTTSCTYCSLVPAQQKQFRTYFDQFVEENAM